MTKKLPDKITKDTRLGFSIDQSGFYAITITARCNRSNDLKIEIDNKKFREMPAEKNIQTYNIPPAWNGNKLRGLSQTNIFLLVLEKGEHYITLIPKGQAELNNWSYHLIKDPMEARFVLEQKAEGGDKRPWFTFILTESPLISLTAETSVGWHLFDGDDIKLVIDNKNEENQNSRLWKNWFWHATPSQILTGSKREKRTVTKNLASGYHFIEFWADKTPTLHQVTFNLGGAEINRDPSKDDPKWTGSFSDDSEVMILARLIFGEARNQSKETMVGVGYVIKNRVKANKGYFGVNYHDVITKNSNGIYQFSSFNPNDPNHNVLIDPLPKDVSVVTRQAWFTAYEASSGIINNSTADPTDRAVFFHSSDLSQELFTTQSVPGAIFTKQIGDMLFYRDPYGN